MINPDTTFGLAAPTEIVIIPEVVPEDGVNFTAILAFAVTEA